MNEKEEIHMFEEAFESLGKRPVAALKESSFETLKELHEATDEELVAIVGIGKRTVPQIRGLLAAKGFEKAVELEEINAAAKINASVAVPDVEQVIEPGRGIKLPRRKGQVVMLINLYDPGFRRKNNDQKLSVRIGDVIWGNKDKEWDLPRVKVDDLISKGEAA